MKLKCDESFAVNLDNSRNRGLLGRPLSINIYIRTKQETVPNHKQYVLPIIDLHKSKTTFNQYALGAPFKPSKSSILLRMLRNKVKNNHQLENASIHKRISNTHSMAKLSKSLIYPINNHLCNYSLSKLGKSLKSIRRNQLSCGYLPSITPLSDKCKVKFNDAANPSKHMHTINCKLPNKRQNFYHVLTKLISKYARQHNEDPNHKCKIIEQMYKKEICAYLCYSYSLHYFL